MLDFLKQQEQAAQGKKPVQQKKEVVVKDILSYLIQFNMKKAQL